MGFKSPLALIAPAPPPIRLRTLQTEVYANIIVVDDNSILPLGRPTLTTALDEHTRCPVGFYAGFEPPSCLAVMS